MPSRCARCGAFSGRAREMPLPAAWLAYLKREHGVADPVGTLKLPLCPDCYREATDIAEAGNPDARNAFLDAVEPERLIDEG